VIGILNVLFIQHIMNIIGSIGTTTSIRFSSSSNFTPAPVQCIPQDASWLMGFFIVPCFLV